MGACQRDPESRTGKGSKRGRYPTNRYGIKLKRVLREGCFAEGLERRETSEHFSSTCPQNRRRRAPCVEGEPL